MSNFILSASERKRKKIKQIYNTTQRNEKHRQTFVHVARNPIYIHLLFTRNGSNKKKEIQKEKIKKYTNIKSESTIKQYAL